jgi:uncharacterized protein with ATP-grasp and redox domains
MISDHRCFFCFVRAFEKLLEKESISDEAKSSFTLDMISLYQNKRSNFSAPLFSRELHHILRSYTHNPDPYKEVKKENNDQAINMLPELEYIIQQSEDHFNTALRLAIAGNIIDFAASDNFDLQTTIDKALLSEFAVDHSVQLKVEIEKAKSILYLGDNAGEIVFDKLFIREMNQPDITFVVRGEPVINDATMNDSEYIGMKNVANVISNGEPTLDINPGKAYLAIPIRPPSEESVNPSDSEKLNMAWQIFNKNHINTEFLTGFEGTDTGFTGNIYDDILNITAVHPLRQDSLIQLLRNDNFDFHVVKSLIKQRLIRATIYNGNKYYLREYHLHI